MNLTELTGDAEKKFRNESKINLINFCGLCGLCEINKPFV
jgi:hypothetical protein